MTPALKFNYFMMGVFAGIAIKVFFYEGKTLPQWIVFYTAVFFIGVMLYTLYLTHNRRKKFNHGISKKTGMPWQYRSSQLLASGPTQDGVSDKLILEDDDLTDEEWRMIGG